MNCGRYVLGRHLSLKEIQPPYMIKKTGQPQGRKSSAANAFIRPDYPQFFLHNNKFAQAGRFKESMLHRAG